MYKFSKASLRHLRNCDTEIQRLMFALIEIYDVSIICSHRSQEEQDAAFASGNSKASWGRSPHNHFPSKAIDIIPCVSGVKNIWDRKDLFDEMGSIVKDLAYHLDIPITWGGDFNSFYDGPHFEVPFEKF